MVVLFLGIIGICLGSFVNALVWRLHEQEELKEKKPKAFKRRLSELSISKGRSMCPHCRQQLRAKDLVPVLSWLSIKGRCRYCSKPISVQYPFVELLMGILFVLSCLLWPYNVTDVATGVLFGLWLVLVVGFVAHSIYDIRWYTLLDRVTLPLTVIGVIFVSLNAYIQQDVSVLVGAVVGAAALFGLFYGLFQVSKGAWIGGGDVKLAPLLGMLAGGLLEAMLLLFVASALGTLVVCVVTIVQKKKLDSKMHIPFGPFLIMGAIVVVLFGQDIISWYTQTLLAV